MLDLSLSHTCNLDGPFLASDMAYNIGRVIFDEFTINIGHAAI